MNFFLFSIPDAAKLTSMHLFWILALCHICSYFAFVLLYVSLVKGWSLKSTLSMKILDMWHPELEFCSIRKKKKIS